MLKRRGDRGLTLVEILLALIVMVLGILGILALFPPAMESAKESMEETNAAIFGESVAHAIKNAIQLGKYDTASTTWYIRLKHDLYTSAAKGPNPPGLPPADANQYDFLLPRLADSWVHHPGGGAAGDPATIPAFQLGQEPAIQKTLQETWDKNDPTDPHNQFLFSFDIRKINTLDYLLQAGAPMNTGVDPPRPYNMSDLEAMTKLYEFRIHVLRGPRAGGGVSGGTGTGSVGGSGSGGAEPEFKNLVATITYRVTTK